jgi:hypothetical protein
MKALVVRVEDVLELLPATTFLTYTGKASYIPVHPSIRMDEGGYHLLKDLDTEAEQLQMMQQLTDIAYNTAVQRLEDGRCS